VGVKRVKFARGEALDVDAMTMVYSAGSLRNATRYVVSSGPWNLYKGYI